jgi:prephenate dehydrogenase
MSAGFGRVTIIGVGLLGASLGLALKARKLADTVVGVGRRKSSLETALSIQAVDHVELDTAAAVAESDLVVVATPAANVCDQLDTLRNAGSTDLVVTDVASTKRLICAHADATWTSPRRFIGSHPMAGGEKFGPEHGRADLYEGSVCLVESGVELDPEARETVCRLWQAVGARVVSVEAGDHDALLARTSHLPHVLATAAADIAGRQGDIRSIIGNGYRDVTRVAAGRPEIWRDICLTNREALLKGLDEMRGWLDTFHEALADHDGDALEQMFQAGKDARDRAVPE